MPRKVKRSRRALRARLPSIILIMAGSGRDIHRFARQSAIYGIGNLLNRVGAFLLLPIYTSFLSTAEYGALELLYVVAGVISGVLSVGLSHATLRFFFDYDNNAERRAVISTNLLASLVIAGGGVGIIAFWRSSIALFLFSGEQYSDAVLLVLVTLVFQLSIEICHAYLRARERALLFVGMAATQLILQVSANSFLVVVLHAGVQGVLLGNLCSVAVVWAILFWHTTRECGLAFRLDMLLPVLRYSAPFVVATIVGVVGGTVDRFLINGMLTLEAVGIFALAVKFANLMEQLIGQPFARAYGAFRFSIMNNPQAAVIQARLVRYLFAGASVGGLGILFFARDLLTVMSHPEFWPAAQILPMLILASTLNLLVYPVQSGILFKKRSDEILYLGVANAMVHTIGALALIYWFGLQGAGGAALLASAINLVLTHLVAQRWFPVQYEYGRLASILGLAALCYLTSLAFAGLPWSLAVLAKAILLLAFVVTSLASPIFEKRETAYLVSLLKRTLSMGIAKSG